MKSVEYIEIDVPVCSLNFGVAPCTAAGAVKCFNTKRTCQDRENYDEAEVTLRYAKPVSYLPRGIDIVAASIDSISLSPGTISLGENLGTRASLTVVFSDHRHADTGEGHDKYYADRDYDPFKRGTYWGKFRARQRFLQGRAIRWRIGTSDQAIEQMETRHYVIESFDGPTPAGKYTLIAKDVLKLADGDRSQAPVMSTGYLSADISAGAGSLTLLPTGIGNAEYPAAGTAVIGGKEVVTFTRVADVMTITRARHGTVAAAFKAQDRVQIALDYVSKDVAEICYDLAVNYAGIPAEFINLPEWLAETGAFIGQLYSGVVCEPTAVSTLLSELIQQAGLSIWWDEISQKLRLQVIRGVVTGASRFTPDNTLEESLTTREQPEKRISQVWIWYGQINPTVQLSNTDNFRSTSVTVDDMAEQDYGPPVIKKIFSRWIPALGRSLADRLGVIQLSRYRDPPRKVTFDLQRYASTSVVVGGGYRVETFASQDATGAREDISVQVVRLNPLADRQKVEAEEVLYQAPPDDFFTRRITIDFDTANLNLREAHDSIYAPPTSGVEVEFVIAETATVYSTGTMFPAIDVGNWPVGVSVKLSIAGHVRGAGGAGGNGNNPAASTPPQNGSRGGTAIYTRATIVIDFLASATIWSGGGGGAGGGTFRQASGGGGGGGAGRFSGIGGWGGLGFANGQPGTEAAGGAGGNNMPDATRGGRGGDPGMAGADVPTYSSGGAAGYAIDGVSHVTFAVNLGDLRGPSTN